jgi:viroplasmin and RNaseH domain-containing protein
MGYEYYAVVKGRRIGVFDNWPECHEQVNGYSGAVYKGFKTRSAAIAFFNAATANGSKQRAVTRSVRGVPAVSSSAAAPPNREATTTVVYNINLKIQNLYIGDKNV